VFNMDLFLNPTFLRLCRMARLLRLLRLIKWVEALDSLHVLIKSIRSSLSVLIWASLLISVMITSVALVVNNVLEGFFAEKSIPVQQRTLVYESFGTFSKAAVSFFEATFGNFAPVMRVLTRNVDESWAVFFIVYRGVGGFAIVTVITGVFLHETFKVANSDNDLMVIQQRRKKQVHLTEMTRLFAAADSDLSGHLTFQEFHFLMADPFVGSWMAAYEIDVTDVELLFCLMDDGDGTISANELVTGVSRLKGYARSMDLHAMNRTMDISFKQLSDKLGLILDKLPGVGNSVGNSVTSQKGHEVANTSPSATCLRKTLKDICK